MLLLSILNSGIFTVFCGCRNSIHLDLFTFIDNLFSFSHNDSFLNHDLLYFDHIHQNPQLMLYHQRIE